MKNTVLFGAGQIGIMCRRLMGAEYRLLCFADNYPGKWGTAVSGLPVCSPEEALAMKPECVVCCVLDDERSGAMMNQLGQLGYTGEIVTPAQLKTFDARYGTMRLLAEQIGKLNLPGDTAELGVFRGDFAAAINAAFPGRTIHLFDTFTGFAEADILLEEQQSYSRAKTGDFSDTAQELVAQRLPFRERAVFHPGFFPDSFSGCEGLRFAFVSLDADLYAPTAAALPLFYDRLVPGGVILVHDVFSTQYTGVQQAVNEFCCPRGILPMPICDLHGSVVIRKPLTDQA